MRRVLYLILVLLINFLFARGQQTISGPSQSVFKAPVNPSPAVPSAAAFLKYGDVPVSHSNGVPNVSVPVHTIKLKGLSWPVSLSYNAGGFRPSEIASSAGLGWVLNAGGVVTVGGGGGGDSYGNTSWNLAYSGGDENECEPQNSGDIQAANDLIGSGGSNFPSLHSLTTAVFSGRFFFTADVGRMLPASNKRIEKLSNPNRIKVTDENGNQFLFSVLAHNVKVGNCTGALQGSTYSRSMTLSYYLSQVTTYYGETLTFRYQDETYNYQLAPLQIKRKRPDNNLAYCTVAEEEVNCSNSYNAYDKRLYEIESSNGELIKITYASGTRSDLPGASVIQKIEVFLNPGVNQSLLSRYDLITSYLGQGAVAEALRLKLDKVKVYDASNTFLNSYDFFYNETALPSRLTGDFIFNAYQNNTTATYNISEAGILKRIQYPTGGETHFQYEVLAGLGKLRIKKVADFEVKSGLVSERSFSYGGFVPDYAPVVFIKGESLYQISNNGGNGGYDPNNDGVAVFLQTCYRSYWQSEPIVENQFISLTPTFYPSITEEFGYKGANGKIEYTYELPFDAATEPVMTVKKVYEKKADGSFGLKEETLHQYELAGVDLPISAPPHPLATTFWVKTVDLVQPEMSHDYSPGGPGGIQYFCPVYSQYNYPLVSAPVLTKKVTTKSYDGSQLLANVVDYYYDNEAVIQPSRVETTKSDGKVVKQETFFPSSTVPSEVTLSTAEQAALTLMQNQNLVSAPFYERTKVNNVTTNRNLIRYATYSSKVLPSVIVNYPSGGNEYKESTISSYNSSGNPKGLVTSAGKSAILYETRYHQPIAVAINATPSQIAYTSFEKGEELSFSQAVTSVIEGEGVTGTSSYNLSNGSLVTNEMPLTDFTISLWVKNGSGTVSTNGQLNAIKTVGGWTLMESFAGEMTQLTISGTAQIDEVRIYPHSARLKTYTYKQGVGISSTCSENNEVVNYSYDAAGRLLLVRNEKGEVLKKMEYAYEVNKPIWQPTTTAVRCKACPVNSIYTSNVQEREEEDTNPLSISYGIKRWVEIGANGNCQSLPDWQPLSTTRCQQLTLDNQTFYSGWQERKQRDMNPCSNSYLQERWVLLQANTQTCTPDKIYVKFQTDQLGWFDDANWVAFSATFYADYYCTIPVSVSNLTVTLLTSYENRYGQYVTNSQNYTCNGYSTSFGMFPTTAIDPNTSETTIYEYQFTGTTYRFAGCSQ